MPLYRVIVPAYTRVEEIHTVQAKDKHEAKYAALEREPDSTVEDADYYQPAKDDVRVEEVTKPFADLTDQAEPDSEYTLEFDPDAPMHITFGEQHSQAELVATPTPAEIASGEQKHPHFALTLEAKYSTTEEKTMAENPARAFLRQVERLRGKSFQGDLRYQMYSRDIPDGVEKQGDVWIWQGRRGEERAVWKLAKESYCNWGRPCYIPSELAWMLKDSETEKVLGSHEGYEFVWLWDEWVRPDPDYWGVVPAALYYVIRKDGEEVYRTTFKSRLLSEWQFITTGTRPAKRKRKPNLLKASSSHKPAPGSPWDERLFLQIVNESKLYPRLKSLYFGLAPLVVQEGKTEDDFWERFMPVVEDYWPKCHQAWREYYECPNAREHIPILERRRAAYKIAERFRIECQINPYDFGL